MLNIDKNLHDLMKETHYYFILPPYLTVIPCTHKYTYNFNKRTHNYRELCY